MLNTAQRDAGRDPAVPAWPPVLGPQGWRLCYAGAERTRQVSCSPLAGGQLSACMGWMVQGMSGAWFHLQPSCGVPQLLSTLLPMARSTQSWQAGHQECSIPPWTWTAWGCQVATAASPPLPKRAPVRVPKLLPGIGTPTGMANPTALMRFYTLELYFSGAQGEMKVSKQRAWHLASTTPGQLSEAYGDPAPPWGTHPTLAPGHCCPQGLGTVRDGECWVAIPTVPLSYL